MKQIAIIHRGKGSSTLNGANLKTEKVLSEINRQLKAGTAKKLVDTENTLMYELTSQS